MDKMMAVTTETSRAERIWGKMKGWIAAERTRRETLRLLRNCRDEELRDAGLTREDVERARDACEVVGTMRARAGNW
jgi:uncharacterized protein YjiS (DUF1127 family)